jgi:hypothetical protein
MQGVFNCAWLIHCFLWMRPQHIPSIPPQLFPILLNLARGIVPGSANDSTAGVRAGAA